MGKRTKRIMFRCTEEEYDRVRNIMNQLNTYKSIAGYVRDRALGFHIPSFSAERAKCLIHLNNLLNDLNELQQVEMRDRLLIIKQLIL